MKALTDKSKVISKSEPEKGITGTVFEAYTDKGSAVEVWRGDDGLALEHRYFCHGLTLDTWSQFQYSPGSGAKGVNVVLADEFSPLTTAAGASPLFSIALPAEEEAQLQAMLKRSAMFTVVAWLDDKKDIVHTAYIAGVEFGNPEAGTTVLFTKNGFNAPRQMHLAAICGVYARLHATHFQFHSRNKPPSGCCTVL